MNSRILALTAALAAVVVIPGEATAQIAKANSEAGGDLRAELTELKRTGGDTVTMKLVVVNDSNRTFNPGPWSQAYLMDTQNKKKLGVIRDDKKHWLASQNWTARPHARTEVWAKFPAPPEGVQKVTLVMPKFSPMEDVPISK